MDDDDSGGQSWSQALLSGVSAVVDSQLANQFGVNTGAPNSQYGTAGQPATAVRTVGASPVIWIALAAAGLLVVVLVLKK